MTDIRQDFVEMMNRMTQGKAKLGDKVDMDDLKENCAKIQEAIMPCLKVDIANGYEPCPFCFSGGDKLAELVWVGLNPGKPMDDWNPFSKNTTWQELADYCAPAKGILASKKNVYRFIAEKGVSNTYYRTVLRLHHAFFEGVSYDTWTDLVKGVGKGNIEKVFLDCFAKHPVLNADLLPYKSSTAAFSVSALAENPKGKAYLDGLISLIENKSTEDAYVVFFGKVEEVKVILENRLSFDRDGQWDEQLFPSLSRKKTFSVFFRKWGKRKLILSPFCGKQTGFYRVTELQKAAKAYFGK